LRAEGESAIIEEMTAFMGTFESPEAHYASRDEYGWADHDWMRYCCDAPGEEDFEKMASHLSLVVKSRSSGFDKERAERTIDSFCKLPVAEKAGLDRGHILALRIFSGSVSRRINRHLHDGCSPERPHPYPALVLLLADALTRLRPAQAKERVAASLKATQLAEAARKAKDDPDLEDDDKAVLQKKAVDAAAASEAMQIFTFWTGTSSIDASEFTERGATEIGFMSLNRDKGAATFDSLSVWETTSKRAENGRAQAAAEQADEDEADLPAAAADAPAGSSTPDAKEVVKSKKADLPVLLFRVTPSEATVPIDLSFVAVRQTEGEYVYPPCTYLEQRKEWKDSLGKSFTVGADAEEVQCTAIELNVHLESFSNRR